MKPTPTFSIIIPTYNSHDLIGRLLDSIPNDDAIEIIIVDDHSQDYNKLEKAIKEHPTSNKVLLTSSNGVRSAGAARNTGLEIAKGEWVLFADSDDYFTENLIPLIYKYSGSNSDLVVFAADGNHLTNRVRNLNSLLDNPDINQVRYRHVVPWSKLVRKSVIDMHNLKFSEVIVSNDELFSTKIGYFSNKISLEKRPLYYSRERQDSLTTQKHSNALQDIRMNEVLKKYKFLQENIGERELNSIKLSILSNIKGAVKIGGIAYGIGWYRKIRKAGGRIRPLEIIKRKINI